MLTRRLAITILALILAGPALADGRQATLETLARAASLPDSGALELWISGTRGREDGGAWELELGDEFRFGLRSPRTGYLTSVYVDSHGVAMIFPSSPTAAAVQQGAEQRFPDGEGLVFNATPPLGSGHYFAFVTPTPLTFADLGRATPSEGYAVLDTDEAPLLARRLERLISAQPADRLAAGQLSLRTVARAPVSLRGADPHPGDGLEYSAEEIVEYFTLRTRSGVKRPRLDVHVQFPFDSAVLSPGARRNLDQMGRALNHPAMSERSFLVAGHTDDLGPSEYNVKLSWRRAEAVRTYLIEGHGIGPERLELQGHGEAAPLEPGTNDWARQMNRRVEFQTSRVRTDRIAMTR